MHLDKKYTFPGYFYTRTITRQEIIDMGENVIFDPELAEYIYESLKKGEKKFRIDAILDRFWFGKGLYAALTEQYSLFCKEFPEDTHNLKVFADWLFECAQYCGNYVCTGEILQYAKKLKLGE